MGLCIGYESALRYWLTKRGDEAPPEPADNGVFAYAEARTQLVRSEQLPVEPEPGRPLHLVVPERRLGHKMADVQAHVWGGALPEGSLCRLSGDNVIASPALTFVQIAARAPLLEAAEAGCYLCSTFSIKDSGRGYVGERGQLVSLEDLRRYVRLLPPYTHGIRKIKAALDHVVESLASPMEVFLGMAYGMTPQLGGQEALVLHANQNIEIDHHIQSLLGSRYLKGDLYLPEFNADLEYDSYEYHTGRYRLDHTQARRNALEAMGVKTITATYGQLSTFNKFESFTWMLRERLGLEHPTYSRAERAAQIALYELLMSPSRRLF